MGKPVIHGPSYSTYVRTVRIVLEEKGVDYELRPVDILTGAGHGAEHIARHPFGKVPGFEHDGFGLYETSAIARYCDRALPGAKLQPADVREAARMDQIVGVVDSYAYGAILGKLVWQRLVVPMQGGQPDEAVIAAGMPMVELCLSEFERLKGPGAFLVGNGPTLADAFLAPIFGYLSMTPDFAGLTARRPGLSAWWAQFSERPSMQKTPPQFG